MKGKKKFWLIFSVAAVVLFVWIIRYKAINQDYRQRWSAHRRHTPLEKSFLLRRIL